MPKGRQGDVIETPWGRFRDALGTLGGRSSAHYQTFLSS